MKHDNPEPESKFESLFADLGQSIEELWHNYPPEVTLRGWWWKKYFSHYRLKREILQRIVARTWHEEGEAIRKEITHRMKDEILHGIMSKHK